MSIYLTIFYQIDKAMMDELKEVKKAVNPTEVLLVVDAMTGQEAAGILSATLMYCCWSNFLIFSRSLTGKKESI